MKKMMLGAALLFLFLIFCSSPNTSDYSPPSDHTVKKDGIKHKAGLNNPNANCVSCHGADLRGGSTGVSCYECHGKKW